MNPNGLTKRDWKAFSDLLLKANNIQLVEMDRMIFLETDKRFKATVE